MIYRQGEIVLVPFPYSDLSGSKRRPVLIVSNDTYNASFPDVVVVVVTSKVARIDAYTLAFDSADLDVGQLPEASLIRAHKLFTIDQSRIVKRFSFLSAAKLQETLLLLRRLFDHPALHQPDKAPQAEKV